jgi:hypothetical protein
MKKNKGRKSRETVSLSVSIIFLLVFGWYEGTDTVLCMRDRLGAGKVRAGCYGHNGGHSSHFTGHNFYYKLIPVPLYQLQLPMVKKHFLF